MFVLAIRTVCKVGAGLCGWARRRWVARVEGMRNDDKNKNRNNNPFQGEGEGRKGGLGNSVLDPFPATTRVFFPWETEVAPLVVNEPEARRQTTQDNTGTAVSSPLETTGKIYKKSNKNNREECEHH
jgi:hypothetical protein